MFKKKANLPPRPPYPKNADIFEDLAKAKDCDVLFTLIPSSTSKFPSFVNVSTTNKTSTSASDSESTNDLSIPEKSYHKIKTFDEKVEYTEKNIEILQEQHQKLTELKKSLLEDIAKVKKACGT